MGIVATSNIRKTFGGVNAVNGISLTVRDGEFMVLLGPSGCGKTTFLRIIAGLEQQTDGDVEINGEVVNDLPPRALIGEYGYAPASNQAGIVTPTFSTWLDATQAASYGNNYAFNPQKAISILEAAGFKKGPDGIMAKGSQKLSFTVLNNGGFSDWVAAMQVITADLKAVGIQLTPDNVAYTTWQSDTYTGKFQLAYYAETGGPSPYYELRQWLYSANSAPIGTAAGSNWERYSNPAADKLINEYADHHQRLRAALDREPASEDHAAGRPGDPGHRAGQLVPVRHRQLQRLAHPGQPVRAASHLHVPGLGTGDGAPGAQEVAPDAPADTGGSLADVRRCPGPCGAGYG